jgi:hypothetical protein
MKVTSPRGWLSMYCRTKLSRTSGLIRVAEPAGNIEDFSR